MVACEPKYGQPKPRRNGGRDFQHPAPIKRRARLTKMHISTRNESRMQRRVIAIASLFNGLVTDGKHTWLAITAYLLPCDALQNLFRLLDITFLRLEMVNAVAGHLVTLAHDTLHHLWRILSEICRAEERGSHSVAPQNVENTTSALGRYFHSVFQGNFHAMFARQVKFFCVKTE